jgi:Tail-tube assembly protein
MANTPTVPTFVQDRKPDDPLGDLDVNQYSYASFIYPMDLGVPGAGKDHYMVFHINETSTTQFATQTVNGQAPKDLPTINQNTVNDLGGKNPNDPDGKSTQGANGANANQPIVGNTYRPIQRVATTIVLYMPEVSVNYAADWSKQELGLAKDIYASMREHGSLKSLFELGGSAGVSILKNVATGVDDISGLNFTNTASFATRMVINNHLEVIFNGIDFRQFNFTFRFTPESEEEALNVDNIIRAFKFYAAPEILTGWAGRFWIYPAEFDIQYYANGKENLFLNKISTCALTNMQVNYTPTGHWSAFRSHSRLQGAPSVCTDITLQFTELELITKKRVLEGY